MMTLGQALTTLKQLPETGVRRHLFLACGFEPLHLLTYWKAELSLRLPGQPIAVSTGLYGGLETTLAAAARSEAEAVAVVIEFSDLDPRLGLRSSGGWGPSAEADILASCQEKCGRLQQAIRLLAARKPVALAGPSLPPLLLGHTPGWRMSAVEAKLNLMAAGLLADAAASSGVAVLQPARLAREDSGTRLDAKLELTAGFPYTLSYASALAGQLVQSLFPPSPMKGLITDLDGTLWAGIVGEVGIDGIAWQQERHAQMYGLYQQQLKQLAECGVLLAVASKNEPSLAEEALAQPGLYVPRDVFFPVCASWGPKSEAVASVLAAWNVGPESVVFVDDNPLELAEVGAAFPAMTCLPFPRRNANEALALMERLRDLFGKPGLQREDTLRRESLRANAEVRAGAAASGEFLAQLNGRLVFNTSKDASNKRQLELLNKTNQFNLNGQRLSESGWTRLVEESDLLLSVSYEDKFGPLGTISVIAGRWSGARFTVTHWVLSCRAFSRRIEHHTLARVFEQTGAAAISLAFQPTARNQPLQEFLRALGAETGAGGEVEIQAAAFLATAELPHQSADEGAAQTL
jgi:FkbH-like protein